MAPSFLGGSQEFDCASSFNCYCVNSNQFPWYGLRPVFEFTSMAILGIENHGSSPVSEHTSKSQSDFHSPRIIRFGFYKTRLGKRRWFRSISVSNIAALRSMKSLH